MTTEEDGFKKAYPFNLSDEGWLKQVSDQMNGMDSEHPELKYYSNDAKQEVIRRHIQAINHNKKDKATLTPRNQVDH